MTEISSQLRSALTRAADDYGTPLYLTDLGEIRRRAEELGTAFPDPWIRQYSLKANPLPALVARLSRLGLGANAVSLGEWTAAGQAGLANSEISLEGIGKTDLELEAAVRAASRRQPLRWLTLESEDEAGRLAELVAGTKSAGGAPEVLVRLNPAVEADTHAGLRVGGSASKFGMSERELLRLLRSGVLQRSGVRVRGLHVHVGSSLSSVSDWVAGAMAVIRLRQAAAQAAGEELDTVDVGGGFPASGPPGPGAFARGLEDALVAEGLPPPARLAIEPGRYPVAAAGWLLARVLHRRERDGVQQLVLDCGFGELVRPALYGAVHEVLAVAPADGRPELDTAVEGGLCESTDSFGRHKLPPMRRGDLLVFAATGAYAASMFSGYNGRPKPPELLLEEDQSLTLGRERLAYQP